MKTSQEVRLPKQPVAVVVAADSMDDETLFKHINARHQQDVGMADVHYSPTISDGLIGLWRAYHRRLHDIEVPRQYDHEHEED